jgi:hypothetical protein
MVFSYKLFRQNNQMGGISLSILYQHKGADFVRRFGLAHSDSAGLSFGGEGGIRTHGTPKRTTVFETVRFNHSRTSPYFL